MTNQIIFSTRNRHRFGCRKDIVSDAGWTGKMEVEELPLAKLFVTILQRLGVESDAFAGETGTLARV